MWYLNIPSKVIFESPKGLIQLNSEELKITFHSTSEPAAMKSEYSTKVLSLEKPIDLVYGILII